MLRYAAAIAAAGIVFLIMDAAWIAGIAQKFYQAEIGALLKPKPELAAAAAFYILYLVGLMVFATRPGLDAGQWTRAAILGALFGLVAYGTYDLTNLATMKGFTLKVALVDMTWGALVSSVSATAAYFAGRSVG